jgi:acyl-CoA synthetase (AMP-forming)/AMP-acid ligase II
MGSRTGPGASPSADRLREQLRDRIARYKMPKHLRVLEQFPLAPSGKARKFRLRQMFAAEGRTPSQFTQERPADSA